MHALMQFGHRLHAAFPQLLCALCAYFDTSYDTVLEDPPILTFLVQFRKFSFVRSNQRSDHPHTSCLSLEYSTGILSTRRSGNGVKMGRLNLAKLVKSKSSGPAKQSHAQQTHKQSTGSKRHQAEANNPSRSSLKKQKKTSEKDTKSKTKPPATSNEPEEEDLGISLEGRDAYNALVGLFSNTRGKYAHVLKQRQQEQEGDEEDDLGDDEDEDEDELLDEVRSCMAACKHWYLPA